MRPNGEELLRGAQAALATYVLPEVATPFAQLELMLTQALLGAVADEWDSAAQRLVESNAALRDLCRRGAEALAAGDPALANELRALAEERDPSVRLSELSAANDRLRAAVGRLGAQLEGADAPPLRALRADLIDRLRADAAARSRSLLGPRADG